MTYPNSTGHAAGSATSQASAEELDRSGRAGTIDHAILGRLLALKVEGTTADELTAWLQENGFPTIHNGSVAGRLVTLEQRDEVIATTTTRRTRSNREATVYVEASYRGDVQALPKRAQFNELKPKMRELLAHLNAGKSVRVEPGGFLHTKLIDVLGSES